jgi:serine O-acetyltransferase
MYVKTMMELERMSTKDDVWLTIREEAEHDAQSEPILASFLYNTILNHESLESALSYHLAGKLEDHNLQPTSVMELFLKIFKADPSIGEAVRNDIRAVKERDPACRGYCVPFLYFKGFHALQSFRMAHWLWNEGRISLAMILQSRISEVFAVDIHPAARIGHGIMFDHATSIVIGETAVIGNNVSILHGVTLGGTGKESGDRHPKLADGVLIGAGTKLLGNIKIGEGAKVGAGSVVLTDLPSHCTAVGVPARIVGTAPCDQPALEMNHMIDMNNRCDGPCKAGQ